MNHLNFLSDYLIASVNLAIPLAFAALGGMYSERSGVLNIALEGMLLTGAFTSAVTTLYTGNPWIGVFCALIAGGLVGLLHAFLCVTLYVNQLVSGLAINLVAAGLTSFLARLVFHGSSTQRLPGIEPIIIPGLANIPILGALLFQQDIFVYLLIISVIVSNYILFHTSLGLTLRAVGEYPKAAATAGVSVSKVQYAAVFISGCLASLGGAYLTLVQIKFFTENMSAGKGFIAIAALIFGRWHPLGITLACFLFGATEALQLRIQALGANIPYQFLAMLPYAIAFFALVGLAGKSKPPQGNGVTYSPEHSQDI
ncbi:nucleoside ABC transporter membrane protein [Trichormus variabilis ATCC 29413]|uniref:Nucleoside ABC transporter membrane protein n=2 Tax=Anabaena variabilis TaxID=264691 RepID=Q3M9W8_TRIV2|nr:MULTISPECIES: ABC transporter permease [Nostocaceae]ABA22218.1 nucleoside ABC transporter membrane protein [Trichormus variabilis ATCC 29413]MBC1214628.1 ABC transporter permease [Trichormus variabilis ARAD]MBC1257272.1 ABC transporter permease [Trichormus variabilis V5]MBC1267080.1 ABC transporter permease [Trichormus variabilis FSR]MBC1301241.1 ABC transporter permease [Trichormus variabilis N2B]